MSGSAEAEEEERAQLALALSLSRESYEAEQAAELQARLEEASIEYELHDELRS